MILCILRIMGFKWYPERQKPAHGPSFQTLRTGRHRSTEAAAVPLAAAERWTGKQQPNYGTYLTTNPMVLKSHTQTHPHKKIYAILGSQHYQWKSWNPTREQTHTNTYMIFRRQDHWRLLTPLKFKENSHWLQIPSYDCQGDIQMEKRNQQKVSTSIDIQHKANIISIQRF